MKRKVLVTLLCLTFSVCVMACGSKNNSTEQTATNSIVEVTETVKTEVVATESVEPTEVQESEAEVVETETEEIEVVATESIDTTEVAESETEVSDVMHEEFEWIKNEAYKFAGCESNHEFIEKYAPGTSPFEAWREYAIQNGADSTDMVWWIYYNGHAAGQNKSYAINPLTGEKIEAGPIVMLRENDYVFFWGSGAEYETNFNDYLFNYIEDFPPPTAD